MKTKWNLNWDISERYVIFNETDEEGKNITSFSLDSPSSFKLHQALKNWFYDHDRD